MLNSLVFLLFYFYICTLLDVNEINKSIKRIITNRKIMKKFLLSIALVAFAFTAFAQEETSNEKLRWKGHLTNRFWDNWEISVGLGGNVAFRDLNSDGAGKFGFEGNFSVAKWFHPIVGARVQLQGGQFTNSSAALGENVKWPYVFAHADAMLNLSNWIGGYRADRVYYAVPFVGFGYQASCFTNKYEEKYGDSGVNSAFAFTYGLLNKFRVGKRFDLNLELKGWLYPESDMSVLVHDNGRCASSFSATVGLTYRFNCRTWQKGYTKQELDVYVNQAQALRDELAAANAAKAAAEEAAAQAKADAARSEAKALAAQTAAEEAAAKAAAAVNGIHAQGNVIFFNYGMSQLTAGDKTRLALIADAIKADGGVYTISGYADANTGSKAGNKRVAANRAKNVYKYLVSCGVNADNLKYDSFGDSVAPFENFKANRAAIITK